MLKGPHIVLAHLLVVPPEPVGTLFPDKDPSDIHDNLALPLRHHAQPLAAALVRLLDDIVSNLGLAKDKHLLLQGDSGEVEL